VDGHQSVVQPARRQALGQHRLDVVARGPGFRRRHLLGADFKDEQRRYGRWLAVGHGLGRGRIGGRAEGEPGRLAGGDP
jgi:hypothetical protein